jgi:hypothetical protein
MFRDLHMQLIANGTYIWYAVHLQLLTFFTARAPYTAHVTAPPTTPRTSMLYAALPEIKADTS